jgi:hypothetical protein
MTKRRLLWPGLAVLALAVVLPLSTAASGAQFVRWDIISFTGLPPFHTLPGGIASATAPDGDTITLTGTGTFVAPNGSNGGSGAVTGGGTWQTTTGSGTYEVKELVSWEFTNLFGPNPFVDLIGDPNARANGTAVLRVEFTDAATGVVESGVLTVGCHGPGAPAGIFEGIATTKGYKTYYTVLAPVGGVDANRTIFHLQ